MDVTLRFLQTLDDALDLAGEIDRYAAQTTAEFRDDPLPPNVGSRLLRRALEAREGVVLTAHDGATRQRIGLCVTAPMTDPLVGDVMPVVVVLHVHPDYRHRGLARQMVRAVVEELEGREIHALAARAGHNDDALISMGERWGFVRSIEVMVRER